MERTMTKRAVVATAAVLLGTLLIGCIPPPEVPASTTTTEPPPPLILDQENNPTELRQGGGGFVLASCVYPDPIRQTMQTFTAGRTGLLDQISLSLYSYGGDDAPPLVVTIHPLLAPDAPDLSVELGRATYAGPSLGDLSTSTFEAPAEMIDIPFETPAPVVAGTQYAYLSRVDLAECGGSFAAWGAPGGVPVDPYPGGQAYFWGGDFFNTWLPSTNGSGDHVFQTWVR
jgi:hypothetical protein